MSKISGVVSLLSLGLSAGLFLSEGFSWARWGEMSGQRLWMVIHNAGLRLPGSSWIGVEEVVEWLLGRSVVITIGLIFFVIWIFGRSAAVVFSRIHSKLTLWRLRKIKSGFLEYGRKSIIRRSPEDLKANDEEALVTKAYEKLDCLSDSEIIDPPVDANDEK